MLTPAHLVSGGEVRYLSDGDVNHHHHVSAVEDVRRLPAGEHILQELEDGMRGRWGVFEYTHGVVCGGNRRVYVRGMVSRNMRE